MHAALRAEVEKTTGAIQAVQRLSGGDISDLYCVTAAQGEFVVKTHLRPPEGFFEAEALGLDLLKRHGLAVPQVVTVARSFLIMEYLSPGEPSPHAAGEALAHLHAVKQPAFGLSQDTYLATLLQNNRESSDWADFYWRQRLSPVLESLTEYTEREQDLWKRFSARTQALLKSCPFPALLHGDLWAGNLYYSGYGPVFIDPACYAGDPLVDIAMTRLFGGFDPEFYAAYAANSPRREEAEGVIRIYQIYPLLVHAKLFGGAYYRSADAIRDSY